MKKLLSIIIALLAGTAAAKEEPRPTWPDLKAVDFLSGRAATKEDVAAGRAVFVLADGEKPIGTPMKIAIPQYAFHVDETKKRTPCVVIQAEEARGKKVVGCRMLNGEFMAGFFGEFILLGDKPPSSK